MDNVRIVSTMPVSQTYSKLSLILDMKAFFQKQKLKAKKISVHCKVYIFGL